MLLNITGASLVPLMASGRSHGQAQLLLAGKLHLLSLQVVLQGWFGHTHLACAIGIIVVMVLACQTV